MKKMSPILAIKIVLLVARLRPFPIRKLGASNDKKLHVEMRPPMLPNMTFVPIPAALAVSEIKLAETIEFVKAPKENAPDAMT